jgi:drug/metabolite transporter (DMT)-like permease
MFSPGTRGVLWCLVFVFLDALQAVYFGNVLQQIDGFLLSGIVFGLSSFGCILWILASAKDQISVVLENRPAVLGLNVTAAGGWLLYLAAVQRIEPAVAFTIFAGSIPIVTIFAGWFGMPEGQVPRNMFEWLGNTVLAFGLTFLAIVTIVGLSGFVRGDITDAVVGVLLAFVAGVFITGMLLYGQRLDRRGIDPVTQFGIRFPLFLILSWLAFGLELDSKGPVSATDLTVAVAIGLVVLAFPIYAVQKAISSTTTLTIGALASTAPLVVFIFQMMEGRVETSLFTSIGLAICFSGALVGAYGATLERNADAEGKH